MNIHNDVVEAIGRTPLIKLKRASEATGCNILGKAEFMNPGQSVKDRAALFIVRDAIARGALRPGGAVVEGDRKSTRLNSSHQIISYAVFCLKKKKTRATGRPLAVSRPRLVQHTRPSLLAPATSAP